ncbi:PTS sugar transporter subunit IIA [uncultured Lactobacillus sp.]|uniref:PTS sugar transporter subunit IIA n=1 Tax=uncultured Lactobacillus sp. TaxID=153152 RepID=UPI0025EC5784|nr:PTS sugar transporter subunit IIA [uncultured Lactobacillus sp.]
MYIDKKLFSEQVILQQQEIKSKKAALTILANELQKKKVVNGEFLPAILKREEKYPTGLALEGGLGVAIPHTDPDKVEKEQLGFISLKKPVKFRQMGDIDEYVNVSMIFDLCLKSPDKQLNMLKNLMSMFTDTEIMKSIQNSTTRAEFLAIIN